MNGSEARDEETLIKVAKFAREGIDLFEHWEERSLSPFFSGDTGERMVSLGFEMDGGEALVAAYGREAWEDAFALETASEATLNLDALGSGIFSHWRMGAHGIFCPATKEESAWFLTAFKLLEAAAEMEIFSKKPW